MHFYKVVFVCQLLLCLGFAQTGSADTSGLSLPMRIFMFFADLSVKIASCFVKAGKTFLYYLTDNSSSQRRTYDPLPVLDKVEPPLSSVEEGLIDEFLDSPGLIIKQLAAIIFSEITELFGVTLPALLENQKLPEIKEDATEENETIVM